VRKTASKFELAIKKRKYFCFFCRAVGPVNSWSMLGSTVSLANVALVDHSGTDNSFSFFGGNTRCCYDTYGIEGIIGACLECRKDVLNCERQKTSAPEGNIRWIDSFDFVRCFPPLVCTLFVEEAGMSTVEIDVDVQKQCSHPTFFLCPPPL